MTQILTRGRGSTVGVKAPWQVARYLCLRHYDIVTRGIPSAHSQQVEGPIVECHVAARVVPARLKVEKYIF